MCSRQVLRRFENAGKQIDASLSVFFLVRELAILDEFGELGATVSSLVVTPDYAVSERLEIVQQLWDSISNTRDEIVVQPWHRDVIRERLAQFEGRETELGLDREEVWNRVDSRRGS